MLSTIAVSPFGVAPHALVVPGCRPGPMPPPPEPVSHCNSCTYTSQPEPPISPAVRVTHLAEKIPPMRHKTSARERRLGSFVRVADPPSSQNKRYGVRDAPEPSENKGTRVRSALE